jgi:uncharacterized membrane protein
VKFYRLYVFSITLSIIVPTLLQCNPKVINENEPEFAKGRIVRIVSESEEDLIKERTGASRLMQKAEVIILDGLYKDRKVTIEHRSGEDPAHDFKIHEGQRVLIEIENYDGEIQFFISDTERSWGLFYLLMLFSVFVIIISGRKGILALVSLFATGALIAFILVPAVLKNYSILPVTVLVAFLSTGITMFLISGYNRKTAAATIGTFFGILIAGLLSYLMIFFIPLTGFTGEDSAILWYMKPDLDLRGVLASGMIIGALGAVMDVAMSIASSAHEIHKADPTQDFGQLFRALMNVGRDIMGTMTNTLILAYTGGALPLLVLTSTVPVDRVLNLNSVATEITAALTGSIGIVATVPLTALVAAYLYKKEFNQASGELQDPYS